MPHFAGSILHLLHLLPLIAGLAYEPYNPVPNPSAVVIQGGTRITVLTPTLVRFDTPGSLGFDDRASFQVVNRNLPVPSFTVTTLNASAVRVTTSVLTITVVDGGGGHKQTCLGANASTDAIQPTRSPTWPNGLDYPNGTLQVVTQAGCCAACNADPLCNIWVWASDTGLCWPLDSDGGVKPGTSRVLGGSQAPLSRGISVSFTGPGGSTVTWDPSISDPANLNGTYSALDCYSTPMECNSEYYGRMGEGLLSQAGWSFLLDPTARMDPAPTSPAGLNEWWSLQGIPGYDVYFQANPSLDYKGAMKEWVSVLGRPALLPRSAFGVWWSRYYEYTQDTIVQEVLSGYANYSIPLNNLVLDMDWHDEPKDKGCESWGNWDVNTAIFPDFSGFLASIHEHGNVTGNPMKVSVNVHPQTGVDHCDSRYPQFAALNGVDPATNVTIPCDFGNKTFIDALYKVYMDALPLQAIDIWWTDYGGCGVSGNNAQLWNNMVIHQHMENVRGVRGQAFSRYGGVGNHRSPHGFSGDTFMHEVALYWQVKTTQTAANVMWGFWSHDIGGFHDGQGAPGDADPLNVTGSELLLRWIQWGVVAPILRTHCSHCERRIWMFPHFQFMRDAMRLRNALGPYIYTEARGFFDTGVAPVHPLYYESPQDATLYTPGVVESEFMHGSRVLAAPITKIMEGSPTTPPPTLPLAVYLPNPGAGNTAWSDWNGTTLYNGGGTVPSSVSYSVGDIPLFVRGGILPFKTMASVSSAFPDPLVWALFPGTPVGEYTLYEDDGESPAYAGGEYVSTPVALSWVAGGGQQQQQQQQQQQPPTSITFTVSPSEAGEALPPGFPQTRTHALQVRGVGMPPKAITVNGVALPPMDPGHPAGGVGWYVAQNHTLVETLGSLVVVGPPTSSWDTTTFSISW